MYQHGAYGNVIESTDTLPPNGVATLPVYVGTAPIQQLSDYSNSINKPILVSSFDEAKTNFGYSDDFEKFTLCEAMYAHFKNKTGAIGPIILINVLDPAVNKTATTASVTLVNKVGYIDENVILSSVLVEGKVKGTDYTVEYTSDGRVKFTAITAITSPVTVTFDKIDITDIDETTIIGEINDTTGKRSGLECVDLVYQQYNMIPTILAAPGFSEIADVYNALVSKCQKINGHWDAVCVVDIDTTTAKTITAAITAKETNNLISKYSKVCFPMVKDGDKKLHLSTVTVVRMQQTDFDNDNAPHVSPSNKQISVNGTVLADDTVLEFDEVQANALNAKGITTVVYSGGQWKLWGPHMGNYSYGADINPEDKFDSSVRIMQYLTNSFQERYMKDVDAPFTHRQIETILDDSQVWLNGLISEGKLLYAKIKFNESSNPSASLVEGNFAFDVATTTTPVGKSITFNIQYTTTGLDTLFGGEE